MKNERCVSRRVGQVFIENTLTGAGVTVYGDGLDTLNFSYIGDLVDGIVQVIEPKKSPNETFNLPYGDARTITDIAQIIENHFPGVSIQYEKRDSLVPERGPLSVDKARRLIDYDPT